MTAVPAASLPTRLAVVEGAVRTLSFTPALARLVTVPFGAGVAGVGAVVVAETPGPTNEQIETWV
ncbi:hypothetical protein IM689_02000 [Dermacoccus barathri]|nr:hypothetical protein [Dermacoccus barathri]